MAHAHDRGHCNGHHVLLHAGASHCFMRCCSVEHVLISIAGFPHRVDRVAVHCGIWNGASASDAKAERYAVRRRSCCLAQQCALPWEHVIARASHSQQLRSRWIWLLTMPAQLPKSKLGTMMQSKKMPFAGGVVRYVRRPRGHWRHAAAQLGVLRRRAAAPTQALARALLCQRREGDERDARRRHPHQ